MKNRLDIIEDRLDEIMKCIHRIEGRVFANDPFMHQIWKEESKLKEEEQMMKVE